MNQLTVFGLLRYIVNLQNHSLSMSKRAPLLTSDRLNISTTLTKTRGISLRTFSRVFLKFISKSSGVR